MAANEVSPSLAALSQLGQSSLESLRSKATGLFGKLGSGGASSMGGDASSHSPAGATTTFTNSSASAASSPSPGTPAAVPLDAAVQEVGSFLKGTVLSVAKRAEQAMVEARGAVHKVPSSSIPSAGGGGGGGVKQQPSPLSAASAPAAAVASPSVFVIEDDEADEEEDEREGGRGGEEEEGGSASSSGTGKPAAQAAPPLPPQPAAKRTSDIDRELALKLHALNGLQKGQEVEVSPEALPGAQLFSVYKQKEGQGQGAVRFSSVAPLKWCTRGPLTKQTLHTHTCLSVCLPNHDEQRTK